MEQKVIQSNFFKTKAANVQPSLKSENISNVQETKVVKKAPVRANISNKVSFVMKDAEDFFEQNKMKTLAEGVRKIEKDEKKEHFTVSVVGEFSRGKSSFLNSFLGEEYLPVSNLPSTAMLTRIRFNSKDVMVLFNEKGQKVKTMPYSEEAWDGLTADNINGNDPKGAVLMGVNCPWLGENSVEMIDTPGAGDLEEGRSKLISEALLGTDGAIITISATTPLSESEQLFIDQRLIMKKVPFLMLIVTKLDMVPRKERSTVLAYIKSRLSLTSAADLPVYVPYDIDMPDDTFDDIIGMDKVKNQIVEWMNHPERSERATRLVQAKMDNIFDAARDSIKEKLAIVEAGDSERDAIIAKKMDALRDSENIWESLKLEMNGRYNECLKFFYSKIDEYSDNMVERLTYEGKRTPNPQKWWQEDYPYKAKLELANIANGIENTMSRKISEDINWFTRTINEKFKAKIVVNKDTIVEKEMFKQSAMMGAEELQLTDFTNQREKARIGTTAASIVGAIALNLSGLGFLSLIATMGVGTGSSIMSERFFKGKIEEQHDIVTKKIAEIVPQMVREACSESENRLKNIYDNVVKTASEEQTTWLQSQTDLIEGSVKGTDQSKREQVLKMLDEVDALQKKMYA